ncbi:hypothetical protein niasHS_004155 [Heterodera schachtii]|uniref:PIPK domain-containing protein n=1 Tax=Heterodera schachtii TaxID=97005 RepID=A0ABD2JM73_HETSC
MIVLSTKTLTLPLLLSILLAVANAGNELRAEAEKLCQNIKNEFNKPGELVKIDLWEEILKKDDTEKEKQRLKEQKEKQAEMEDVVNALNVKWLRNSLGNYLCQKLGKTGGEQEKEVQKESSSKMPEESVITKNDIHDPSDIKYEAEFEAIAEEKIFKRIRRKFRISDEQLLVSLSELVQLPGSGWSGGVYHKTKDNRFILVNLKPEQDEPSKMAEMSDKFLAHAMGQENSQHIEEGKQSTVNSDRRSMMNKYYMYFEMNIYAKLKEGMGPQRKKVIRLQKLQFVLLNYTFAEIDEQSLLKFDIKGTFSPGSAVQYDQKQGWYTGKKDWQNSLYREYDFIGISREGKEISGFFPEGIQLPAEAYRQLADQVKNDSEFLAKNGIHDYSLLLGVQFVNPYTNSKGKKYSGATKKGEQCVSAECHKCKRQPDAEYEPKAELCLYMEIVDTVSPFNTKTEAFYLEMMQTNRKDQDFPYKSMSEFTPLLNEISTPVPTEMYRTRFEGTVLGCLFSPESSTSVGGEPERQFQLGMRQSICKSFGEKRGVMTNYGIEVFGLNMFKEMMETRNQSVWEMLNSFSESLLPSKKPAEFVIEQIDAEKFFNFGSASNSKVKSPFCALFRNGQNYYAVVRNAKAKNGDQQN